MSPVMSRPDIQRVAKHFERETGGKFVREEKRRVDWEAAKSSSMAVFLYPYIPKTTSLRVEA